MHRHLSVQICDLLLIICAIHQNTFLLSLTKQMEKLRLLETHLWTQSWRRIFSDLPSFQRAHEEWLQTCSISHHSIHSSLLQNRSTRETWGNPYLLSELFLGRGVQWCAMRCPSGDGSWSARVFVITQPSPKWIHTGSICNKQLTREICLSLHPFIQTSTSRKLV